MVTPEGIYSIQQYIRIYLCWSLFVCITLCPFEVCNHLDEEERTGCFAFIVFWISCYCKCSVALPHSASGSSAMYDSGIS